MKTMKPLLFGSLWLSFSLQVCSGADAQTGQWEVLFNGQDLKGWTPVHEVTFTVKGSEKRTFVSILPPV